MLCASLGHLTKWVSSQFGKSSPFQGYADLHQPEETILLFSPIPWFQGSATHVKTPVHVSCRFPSKVLVLHLNSSPQVLSESSVAQGHLTSLFFSLLQKPALGDTPLTLSHQVITSLKPQACDFLPSDRLMTDPSGNFSDITFDLHSFPWFLESVLSQPLPPPTLQLHCSNPPSEDGPNPLHPEEKRSP